MGITPRQFEALQARVQTPRRRVPQAATPSELGAEGRRHRVILGIDPSLRGTGWGVIRFERGRLTALGFDTIRCPSGWPRSQCLVRIASALREAIRTHAPTACAVEGLFFAQNLQTALLMGEARGVCLLAAAEAGIEICEIAPRQVKQAMVGYGAAQKLAVARMVQRLLGLDAPPPEDAADALGLALVHAREIQGYALRPRRRL